MGFTERKNLGKFMERYSITKKLGEGSFGSVWAALDKQNGEVVAIKQLKQSFGCSWKECLRLPEIQSLSKMEHPNIVKLKRVFSEYDNLFLVLEYMDCSLFQLMQSRRKRFSETEVRDLCFQIFQGLDHMHKNGYFHCDLKPANLLVKQGRIIKIGDLGSAKEIKSSPPFSKCITTRWYRAPEVMLRSFSYSSKVDMWAMGAVMAEMFALRPLFPGMNEADEMYKICQMIGSPTMESWHEGILLAKEKHYEFPQLDGVSLSSLMPSASDAAIKLIASLCSWDPLKRPTAAEALQHPFFVGSRGIPRAIAWRPAQYIVGIRQKYSAKYSGLNIGALLAF